MREVVNVWLVTAIWLLIGLNAPVNASVPASGVFIPTKACQAYQSIRRKTNPGGVRLVIGNSYPIMEINVPTGSTWFRLRVKEAEPTQRWVYHECGIVENAGQGRRAPGDEVPVVVDQCRTAGLADSHVLALSWQPAFCEGNKNKPECMVTDPGSYQANNFSLHGLWPSRKSCGGGYGFCGKYTKGEKPFCRYDPVPFQDSTLEALGKVMPSAAHGSCLQRHEWYKHGTCQTYWDADGYFDIAMRLLKEFNGSGMTAFMMSNTGKIVSTSSFFEAVDKAFGKGTHQRLQISCRGGKLVDVHIHLPADLSNCTSLGALIDRAKPGFKNRCGDSFEVDPIGQ